MQRRLLLKVDDVSNTYHDTDGFKKIVTPVLDHVSFDVYKGEIVGLVGESGSGKSTLVKCILGMAEHTGTITHYSERPQMVFQNPASALNPSMSVGRILEEALILKGGMSHSERMELVRSTIEAVGLKEENIHCVHESGVKIHGFPDRIEKLDDGSYLVVDFKSARTIGHVQDDIDTCLQIVIYAYLVEQKGFNISGGEFRYIRSGDTVSCKYDDEMKQKLFDKLTVFKDHMKAADFPIPDNAYAENREKDDPDPCKYCKFAMICGKEQETGFGDE